MKLIVYHRRAQEYLRIATEKFPELEVIAGVGEEILSQGISDADIMIAWQFPIQILRKANRLRWIQLTSAGVEQLLGAREYLRDIVVTNTRGMHAEIMADYTLATMVMLQWNFPGFIYDKQIKRWDHRALEPLAGKTLGIVGVGAVGSEIARRAQTFNMNVIGVRRIPLEIKDVSKMFGPDQLKEVLSLSDFVVLVVPATPETVRMIGELELRTMRQTSYLINISRGTVVDESALIEALQHGWIAGASLDVFEREPLSEGSPLWGLENLIITPHIAGELKDYPTRVMDIFGDNLLKWKAGLPLRNQIDWVRGY
jgi:phosphoglycerate dehydrogenase-like enzyme